jgi:hypothetical protein
MTNALHRPHCGCPEVAECLHLWKYISSSCHWHPGCIALRQLNDTSWICAQYALFLHYHLVDDFPSTILFVLQKAGLQNLVLATCVIWSRWSHSVFVRHMGDDLVLILWEYLIRFLNFLFRLCVAWCRSQECAFKGVVLSWCSFFEI